MRGHLVILGLLLSLSAAAQLAGSPTSLKVGHTSLGYILEQIPETKNVSNQIVLLQTQSDNELKRLQKEYQDKYSAYEKGAAQMSEVIRKDRATELENLQARIQEFTRNAEETIQRRYNELIAPISKKAFEVIGEVAKENGYQFIVNTDPGSNPLSNLLFTTSEYDVTKLVLAKLSSMSKPNTPVDKPISPVKAVPNKK